jgi:hypothetical protein
MESADVRTRYILEGNSHRTGGSGRRMRDVLAYDPAGNRSVAITVPNTLAVDVLEALRAAYQQGREDNALAYDQQVRTDSCVCGGTGKVVRLYPDSEPEAWRPGSYADGVVQPCPRRHDDHR